MVQSICETPSILSKLPREIRDQIWYLCITNESEELCNGMRRMSLCLSDCKESKSCFPYEFFGPVCSSLGPLPAKCHAIRRMNLVFVCKQILAETASLYRKILTFTFRSAQCLEAFSVVLGRQRRGACVTKLEVKEEFRPCLRGNEARLTAWRTGIKEKVKLLGNVYYEDMTRKAKWTVTSGRVAEDAVTDIYWFKMELDRTRAILTEL